MMQTDIFVYLFGWFFQFEIYPFNFDTWLMTFLYMMVGITFAVLTRREELTLPSKVGNKIKPGTLGQYVITACLSFFMQAFGVAPLVAGLYAGLGGTATNQLQKAVTTKLSQAEMEDKLREMIDDFEAYKEYSKAIESDRERRVFSKIVSLLKKTPEEIGAVALKIIGKEELEPLVDISSDVIEKVIDYIEEPTPTLEPVVTSPKQIATEPTPDVKMEMSVQEAKDLLRKAKKKSIFSR